jgi:hypothetical protein
MSCQKTSTDYLADNANVRNMSDADHKEIQMALVCQSIENKNRLERIEKLLLVLAASTLFNAVAILLMRL